MVEDSRNSLKTPMVCRKRLKQVPCYTQWEPSLQPLYLAEGLKGSRKSLKRIHNTNRKLN